MVNWNYNFENVSKNPPTKDYYRFLLGKLYKVVQGHTSQADWTPSELPALYKSYMDENIIAEWEQPQGSHDAYQKGDKVIFDSKVYVSIAENNVWKPTEYGWELE